MRHFLIRLLPITFLVLLVVPGGSAAEGTIPILVDGQPLDAKAVAIKDEVYVPAWILENYAHTKVSWLRRSNILEIRTADPARTTVLSRGKVHVRIGVYLDPHGFVTGRGTRLYVLNVDPKEFLFPDGRTPVARANEAAVERIGSVSRALRAYLELPPTERNSSKGWQIVAEMPDEEIAALSDTIAKYELLFKSLYYDLLTNLVTQKEQHLNESSVIDDSLKGMKIDRVPVQEDGSAQIELDNGIHFLFGRFLYRSRQVVWDIPVTVRGGEIGVELSNRNAAVMQ